MEFTRIQHKDTNEIIQYRIDGQRVPERVYRSEEFHQLNTLKKQYICSFTYRTRSGNYKHTFYSSNSIY